MGRTRKRKMRKRGGTFRLPSLSRLKSYVYKTRSNIETPAVRNTNSKNVVSQTNPRASQRFRSNVGKQLSELHEFILKYLKENSSPSMPSSHFTIAKVETSSFVHFNTEYPYRDFNHKAKDEFYELITTIQVNIKTGNEYKSDMKKLVKIIRIRDGDPIADYTEKAIGEFKKRYHPIIWKNTSTRSNHLPPIKNGTRSMLHS